MFAGNVNKSFRYISIGLFTLEPISKAVVGVVGVKIVSTSFKAVLNSS